MMLFFFFPGTDLLAEADDHLTAVPGSNRLITGKWNLR